MSIEVIPAVIPNSIEEIEEKISPLKKLPDNLVEKVQIDFIDGKYAPPVTWPFNLKNELEKDFKLPFYEDVILEADLFIKYPEDWIEDFVRIGIKSFVIHIDSTNYLEKCVHNIKDKDLAVGLGIKPSGDFEKLYRFVKEKPIDFVQFMGNDKVGYNGVELDRKVLRKIADFHAAHPFVPIQVDIGVNEKTARELILSGVTGLVSGSAVFKGDTIKENIEKLKII